MIPLLRKPQVFHAGDFNVCDKAAFKQDLRRAERQFGEGSSMWSMTRTSTGPVCGTSLSPS
jgi:hypothetical protein